MEGKWQMLEARAGRRGWCYQHQRLRPAKVLSKQENAVHFNKTVKFTNFLVCLFVFSVKDLACLTGFSKLPELP